MRNVMIDLETLGDSTDDLIVWANGTSFDFPILGEAFRRFGMATPWHYYHERDCRTLRKLFPAVTVKRTGTLHNALDDAIHQALLVQRIMGQLSPGMQEAA